MVYDILLVKKKFIAIKMCQSNRLAAFYLSHFVITC
jgi:hypothetical protein